MKLTVTSLWFHPALFGAGDNDADTPGVVLSRLIVADVEAVFPAASVATPEITWWAPSVFTATGLGQFTIPESASLQVKVTTTLALVQPAALGAGKALAVIVGGV